MDNNNDKSIKKSILKKWILRISITFAIMITATVVLIVGAGVMRGIYYVFTDELFEPQPISSFDELSSHNNRRVIIEGSLMAMGYEEDVPILDSNRPIREITYHWYLAELEDTNVFIKIQHIPITRFRPENIPDAVIEGQVTTWRGRDAGWIRTIMTEMEITREEFDELFTPYFVAARVQNLQILE